MIDLSFILTFVGYVIATCSVATFVILVRDNSDVLVKLGITDINAKAVFRRSFIVAVSCLIPSMIATLAVFGDFVFADRSGQPIYSVRLFLLTTWTLFYYTIQRKLYESA